MLTAAVCFLSVYGCSRKDTQQSNSIDRTVVEVMTASVVERPEVFRISGQLVHAAEALASFKTDGIIQTIHVDIGDRFRKGQILALLDTTEIAAITGIAAEVHMKRERDYKRIEKLYRDSVATLEQMQDAATAMKTAEADEKRAVFNLEYSMIRAPFDGVVAARLANAGELTKAGMPIFRLVESGEEMTVKLSVPARFINNIQAGDTVELSFEELKEHGSGIIHEIGAVANRGTGHYPIEVRFKAEPRFHEGMIVRGNVKGPLRKCIKLPAAALVSGDEDRGKIYIAEDGKALLREVEFIGFERDSILISAGLPDGSQVIVAGAGFLRDGSAISLGETPQ